MRFKPFIRNICGVCLLLSSGFSHAGNVDILQSYQAAKSHDATFLASRAALDAGAEFVPIARAQLLPNAALTYSRFENDLESTTQNFLGQTNKSESSYASSNTVVSIRQPLLRPQSWLNFEQATAREASVIAVASSESVSLGMRVANVFFAVSLAELSVKVLESEAKMLDQQLIGAQRSVEAGQGSRIDVENVLARLASARSELLAATIQYEANVGELKLLTGLEFDGVAPVAHRADKLILKNSSLPLDVLLAKALDKNPELANLRANIDINRLEVKKTRAAHLPTLDLLLQLAQQDSDNVVNPNAKYSNKQVGVQLTIPLYSGGGIVAQTRQNFARLQESKYQLEGITRRITNELTKISGSIAASTAKINAIESSIGAARQSLQAIERGVEAGTQSRLQAIEAYQRLSQSKFELGREQLVFWLAVLRLEALIGSLDEVTFAEMAKYIHP